MFGIDPMIIGLVALGTLSVGGVAYAVLFNTLESDKKTANRMQAIQVDPRTKSKVKNKKLDEKQRRKQREEALKTLDKQRVKGKKAQSPPLSVRLVQAGLSIGEKQFYIICVIAGLAGAGGTYIAGLPIYVSAVALFVAGFGLPNFVVNFLRKKRMKKFILEFPNAVDVIVRGIKSGLPLNDCLRIIAKDAEDPVRGEFAKVVEAQQLGLTVPEAVARLHANVPTAETNFFAIVIAIQSSAGGNLSEALGNLSRVLRDRKKMADKIKAVSTEAKTSAWIIGALPVIVATLVWLTSPGYMDPLFFTDTGHKVLGFCALSMFSGVMVMRKMINFDF